MNFKVVEKRLAQLFKAKTSGNVKKKTEKKEVTWYKVRNEISEGNDVHCLAFTAPLMDFGLHNDSDNEDFSGMNLVPSEVSAKKKWKKLY